MHKAKEESAESIKIIQEHNWVMNFRKNRIITIEKISASSDPDEYEQAKNDLNEFVTRISEIPFMECRRHSNRLLLDRS